MINALAAELRAAAIAISRRIGYSVTQGALEKWAAEAQALHDRIRELELLLKGKA